jgi:glutamate carboxypeptidase
MKSLALVAFALLLEPAITSGQAADALLARVKQERGAFLKTLQELVSIESGSRDIDGLNRISDVIAGRLRALGGSVEFVAPGSDARFDDTPAQIGRMVLARFKGTGTRRILLLAHMDTVYERGMGAKQPFRIDGDRAYGLGIADDKQGVALILHTLAMLQAMKFQQYGTLTVLITGDEESAALAVCGSRNCSRSSVRIRGRAFSRWPARTTTTSRWTWPPRVIRSR